MDYEAKSRKSGANLPGYPGPAAFSKLEISGVDQAERRLDAGSEGTSN